MSRIGKKPIIIPEKVAVEIDDGIITVKGPQGELTWTYPDKIKVGVDGGQILIEDPVN